MEQIGSEKIWAYFGNETKPQPVSNTKIRGSNGHFVESYVELAKKVAELQFLNRNYVLLFRGQSSDYRTIKGNSVLKASIFRNEGDKIPSKAVRTARFNKLALAERELVNHYMDREFLGLQRMKRHRVLRWAILQHYKVCPTPLLDVTQSLRIAASFAAYRKWERNNYLQNDEAYLYVIAVPNLSGAVTSSSESGMQVVRLSSACPPSAMRPHLQEGYLLGEYPEISSYGEQSNYNIYEMDFARRLISKFRFAPKNWNDPNFPFATPKALLALQVKDNFQEISDKIVNAIGK